MQNWAKNVRWDPSQILYPTSEGELWAHVIRALNDSRKIRTIGTGHSFTALCKTDEILISLDKYQGLIAVDREKCQVTVKGGTKLKVLGALLFEHGMAMENLGDIDVQSIAGTISTGTHGTGKQFGTISTQVVALKFVNGKGDLVSCSKEADPDLFRAAQVSLGLLGIITEVTLQCVPAYKLQLENRKELLQEVLPYIGQRNQENRNFEFYWFPYTDVTWTKSSNAVSDSEPDKNNIFNYWSEYVLENYAFKLLCEYARIFPSQNVRASRISAASIGEVAKVYHSHKVYATQRMVKFQEMEYNIPSEAHGDVFKEVVKTINTRKFNIHFPIENRWVKGDDIYMSPAYDRDSAYIACHVYNKKDCKPYFKALEEIFRAHGGRPHWGKMNTLEMKDVELMYPEFSRFQTIRKEQDPDNIFVNKYLEQLMGI